MNLFPIIQPQADPQEERLPLCREAAWDFKKRKPVFHAGEPVYVTGREAVRVWCWKALCTVRARYEIYSWDHGCELESLVGQNYSDELKQAEAVRYVHEALEVNPYITGVRNVIADFSQGELTVSAVIDTIYGEVTVGA